MGLWWPKLWGLRVYPKWCAVKVTAIYYLCSLRKASCHALLIMHLMQVLRSCMQMRTFGLCLRCRKGQPVVFWFIFGCFWYEYRSSYFLLTALLMNTLGYARYWKGVSLAFVDINSHPGGQVFSFWIYGRRLMHMYVCVWCVLILLDFKCDKCNGRAVFKDLNRASSTIQYFINP